MQTLILLMAGSGSRVGLDINKMMYKIDGKRLYQYVLDRFLKYDLDIILVTSKQDYETVKEEVPPNVKVILGGNTRNESVQNALDLVKTDRVLIHDGARVLVDDSIIEKSLESNSDAYYVCTPLKDTIRTIDDITLDRNNLVVVQTPQGGKTQFFRQGNKYSTTDDISGLKDFDVKIEKILGNDYNFKVTTKFDLKMVELILRGEVK